MIECIKFKSNPKGGSCLGFADLFVPKMGLELTGVRVMRNSNTGHKFISFPSFDYTNKEGEKKYWPYVRFREKNHHSAFEKLAIVAIDKWCTENATSAPQQPQQEEELPF